MLVKDVNRKKTRFQQGGLMLNLARYTPMPFPFSGGTVSASQTTTTSGSEKDELFNPKDIADLLKDALPSDAKVIMTEMYGLMNRIDRMGNDPYMMNRMRSELTGQYLQIRQKADEAKQNLETYTAIRDDITKKSSLGEAVMDESGRVYYKDKNGVKSCNIEDIAGKNLLTYSELLSMRRQNMPFADGLLQVASNATSSKDVIASIGSILSTLKSDTTMGEYYAQNIRGNVREGLEMLAEASSGLYKISKKRTGINKDKIDAAIRTVYNLLPENQKNYIRLKSKQYGMTMTQVIEDMIDMRTDRSSETTVSQIRDYEDEIRKARASAKGGGGSDGEKAALTNMHNILEGFGHKELGAFNLGGADNNFTYYGIMTKGQMDMNIDSDTGLAKLTDMMKKEYLPGLRWEDASFAGASVPFNKLGEFVMNGSSYTTISLPYTKDETTGRIKPDFSRLDDANEASELLRENGITNIDEKNFQQANKIVRDAGIDIQYNNKGEIVTQGYMKFVALNVSAGRETVNSLNGVISDLYKVNEDDNMAEKVEAATGVTSDAPGIDFMPWNTKQIMDGVLYIPYYPNAFTMLTNSESPIETHLPTSDISDLIMYQIGQGRAPYNPQDQDAMDALYGGMNQ